SAAVMMRPPRIRTDIANLPPSARFLLLAARRHLHGRLLPLAPVDVDALALQLRDRRLCEVGPVRPRGRLLDHLELLRDLRRPRERLRIHDPDPLRRWPDERVDLV